MSRSELAKIEQRDRELKHRLQDLGFIVVGSLTERWTTCSTANCRGKADRPQHQAARLLASPPP